MILGQANGSQLGVTLPPGDIWPCLETFLSVPTREGSAPGSWWVEARDAAELPTMHRTAPTVKNGLVKSIRSAWPPQPWWVSRVNEVTLAKGDPNVTYRLETEERDR